MTGLLFGLSSTFDCGGSVISDQVPMGFYLLPETYVLSFFLCENINLSVFILKLLLSYILSNYPARLVGLENFCLPRIGGAGGNWICPPPQIMTENLSQPCKKS